MTKEEAETYRRLDSERKKRQRSLESPATSQSRRASDAAQTSAARNSESISQSQSRRAANAAQTSAARNSESISQSQSRRAANAAQTSAARNSQLLDEQDPNIIARYLGIITEPASNSISSINFIIKLWMNIPQNLKDDLRILPSKSEVMEKYLDEEKLARPVTSENIQASIQHYKLLYSIRRFEIETMTFSADKCILCGRCGLIHGVFMRNSKSSLFPLNPKKFIYQRTLNGDSIIQYLSKKEAKEIGLENLWIVSPCCNYCIKGMKITAGRPDFTPFGGFWTVQQPNALKGLTYVEQQLIAKIQAVQACAMAKKGGGFNIFWISHIY